MKTLVAFYIEEVRQNKSFGGARGRRAVGGCIATVFFATLLPEMHACVVVSKI